MNQVVEIRVTVILVSIMDQMTKGDAKLVLHLRQVSGQVWHHVVLNISTSLIHLGSNSSRLTTTTSVRAGHLEVGCLGLDEYEKIDWVRLARNSCVEE